MNATGRRRLEEQILFSISHSMFFSSLLVNMRLDFIQHENHIFSAPTFCAFVGGSKVHDFFGHFISGCRGPLALRSLSGILSHTDTRNVYSTSVQNKMAHLEKMCKQFSVPRAKERKKNHTQKKLCCFSLLRYQNAINFRW